MAFPLLSFGHSYVCHKISMQLFQGTPNISTPCVRNIKGEECKIEYFFNDIPFISCRRIFYLKFKCNLRFLTNVCLEKHSKQKFAIDTCSNLLKLQRTTVPIWPPSSFYRSKRPQEIELVEEWKKFFLSWKLHNFFLNLETPFKV